MKGHKRLPSDSPEESPSSRRQKVRMATISEISKLPDEKLAPMMAKLDASILRIDHLEKKNQSLKKEVADIRKKYNGMEAQVRARKIPTFS